MPGSARLAGRSPIPPAQARPRAHESFGIDRFAVDADLVVQMRAGRAAARAEAAENVALRDLLAFGDQDFRHMAVAGRQAVAVVDLDHVAVAAHRARVDDAAGGGRREFPAIGLQQIDAGVERRPAEERVGAIAERRGDVRFAASGLRRGTNGIRPSASPRTNVARDARRRPVERGRLGSASTGRTGRRRRPAASARRALSGSSPVSARIAALRSEARRPGDRRRRASSSGRFRDGRANVRRRSRRVDGSRLGFAASAARPGASPGSASDVVERTGRGGFGREARPGRRVGARRAAGRPPASVRRRFRAEGLDGAEGVGRHPGGRRQGRGGRARGLGGERGDNRPALLEAVLARGEFAHAAFERVPIVGLTALRSSSRSSVAVSVAICRPAVATVRRSRKTRSAAPARPKAERRRMSAMSAHKTAGLSIAVRIESPRETERK